MSRIQLGMVKLPGELTDDQAVLISDIFTGSFGTDIAERKLAIVGLSGEQSNGDRGVGNLRYQHGAARSCREGRAKAR
jgi:hypothetical protein